MVQGISNTDLSLVLTVLLRGRYLVKYLIIFQPDSAKAAAVVVAATTSRFGIYCTELN